MNKTCTICSINKHLSKFYKDKRRSDLHASECKLCKNSSARKHYSENKEGYAEMRAKYYKNNTEKMQSKNKEWVSENREELRQYKREWFKDNPGKTAEYSASRRTKKLQATPAWANQFFIEEFYSQSAELSRIAKDGIKFHVDHIIPLVSDLVCGLHCEVNLQILTARDNQTKSNKFAIL